MNGELGRPRRAAPPPLPAPARVKPSPIVVTPDPLEETIVRPLRLEELHAQLATPAARTDSTTQPSVRRRALARAPLSRATFDKVVRKLGEDYRALSTPKRLLIPIAVMILALAAPTSSRAGESVPRAAAPARAAVTPTTAALPASLAGAAVMSAPPSPASSSKVLPSARSLAPAAHTTLNADEQRLYDRAINATLAGEYDSASLAYAKLVMAHPDSPELRAAVRVLAAKQRHKAQR
ncbi:MAG: hypothetical protein JWP97_152 [Labilithrix sp.]|nr:hypothetical protein [Labilithrix sp.]